MAEHGLDVDPGERLLADIRPHWSFLTGPLVVAGAVVAVGVALDVGIPHTSVLLHWLEGVVVAAPCLWLAARVVRWRTTHLVLTSQRVVEVWGVLHRQAWEVPFHRIASVTVVQTLPRRVIGTGRLQLALWEDDRARWIEDVRKPAVVRRVILRRLGQPPGSGPPGAPG